MQQILSQESIDTCSTGFFNESETRAIRPEADGLGGQEQQAVPEFLEGRQRQLTYEERHTRER